MRLSSLSLLRRCRPLRSNVTIEELSKRIAELSELQSSLSREVSRINDMRSRRDHIDTVRFFASKLPTAISVSSVLESSRSQSYSTSRFLRRELPVRLASCWVMLDSLPDGLAHMPSVLAAKELILHQFQATNDLPQYDGESGTLVKVFEKHCQTMGAAMEQMHHLMAKGVVEFKDWLPPPERGLSGCGIALADQYPSVQRALDQLYTSRIGTTFLISQHLALCRQQRERTGDEPCNGLVDPNMSLYDVAKEAGDIVTDLCLQRYGTAPDIIFSGSLSSTMPHVPSHLLYVLVELLKNAFRAVCEYHATSASLPPVNVEIADGPLQEDVCVRITDQGGGIPRADRARVWSYMYTTVKSQVVLDGGDNPAQAQCSTVVPLAGFGYGLPISRLYARYSGGELQLCSMEGIGTDAYLHIHRLDETSKERLSHAV